MLNVSQKNIKIFLIHIFPILSRFITLEIDIYNINRDIS